MVEGERYSGVAATLHWLVAVAVLAQIALGIWMIGIPKEPVGVRAAWFNLHKSIGITLAALVVVRMLWRLSHRPPPLPPSLPRWQQRTAQVNHLLLYGCLLVMPLSGFLGSVFSGFPIRFFGLTLPSLAAKNSALKDLLSTVHWFTAALLGTLIAIHVLTALKHLIDRDGVFERIWPWQASRPTVSPARPTTQGR